MIHAYLLKVRSAPATYHFADEEGIWRVSYRKDRSGSYRAGVGVILNNPELGYRQGTLHFNTIEEFVHAAELLYEIARRLKQAVAELGSPTWVYYALNLSKGSYPLEELRPRVLEHIQGEKDEVHVYW